MRTFTPTSGSGFIPPSRAVCTNEQPEQSTAIWDAAVRGIVLAGGGGEGYKAWPCGACINPQR